MRVVSERHRFRGQIYRVGMNYCLDVPLEVSADLVGSPASRYVGVAGEAGGERFRTRLTPRGGGAFRLFLNGEVRAAAGAGLGDTVEVELWLDEHSNEDALPDDLAVALAGVDGAPAAFAAMTEAQRSGMVAYLARARTASTRARYVGRIVDNVRDFMAR